MTEHQIDILKHKNVYDIGSVQGTIKSEFQLRYLLDATSTFRDNVFHLTMCAYSVNRALGG